MSRIWHWKNVSADDFTNIKATLKKKVALLSNDLLWDENIDLAEKKTQNSAA